MQLSGRNAPYAKLGYSFRKAFKGTSPGDVSNFGLSGANPSSSVATYFHLVYFTIGNNDPGSTLFQIEMGFRAKFFLPDNVAEST